MSLFGRRRVQKAAAVLGGTDLFEDHGLGNGPLDLAALSRRFGEAQKFGTYRVVESHEWQRWVDGTPVRRYRWVSDSRETIFFDNGEPGPAEGNPPHPADLDADDWDELGIPDEVIVMAVAADWSVDPTTLGTRSDLAETGLLGTLA